MGARANPRDSVPREGMGRPLMLLALALGVAGTALALVSVTARRTHQALETASDDRQAAYEMLVALRLLRQHIGESRVGLTGYALTRDSLYGATYDRAMAAFANDTAQLRALVRPVPDVALHLDPIADAVSAYASDVAAVMQVVKERPSQVASVELRRARSALLLEGTRTRILTLEEALYRRLDESADRVRGGVRRANQVVTGALIVGVLVLTGAGGALFVQLRARERAALELRRLNEELETRVQRRTADLAAANQELEAFVSAVAHDLRAPLRSIDGLTALVMDDADRLDQEGRDLLGRVRAASRRMAQLVEDLLKLSRATREPLHREPVDLSALAHDVVEDLRRRQPERVMHVVIAPGLTAVGDARLLRVVLENLFDNAWKFTRNEPRPRVELGVAERNGEAVYLLQDNGAGFDMARAEKLFAPFERLHSATEFEGTGIGLTTVQRIVTRHGGRLAAEGEVRAGAKIFFTLGES